MIKPTAPPLFFLLIMFVFMTACQQPKSLVFKDFHNLTVENLSFSGAALKVDLEYYNPNNFSMQLSNTDLDIYIDSTYLGHSLQDIQVSIPKRNNFTIPLKIDLDVKNLLKNGITSMFNKDVNVRVKGNVKVGKVGVYKNFPVDYTSVQHFSMFK